MRGMERPHTNWRDSARPHALHARGASCFAPALVARGGEEAGGFLRAGQLKLAAAPLRARRTPARLVQSCRLAAVAGVCLAVNVHVQNHFNARLMALLFAVRRASLSAIATAWACGLPLCISSRTLADTVARLLPLRRGMLFTPFDGRLVPHLRWKARLHQRRLLSDIGVGCRSAQLAQPARQTARQSRTG